MSNRDNFQWRPNDNSVTTNLRYDLEAEHWTRSFKSASIKYGTSNSGSFMVIGMVISLLITMVWFILLCIVDIINWGVKLHRNSIRKKRSKIRLQKLEQASKQKAKEVLKNKISKLKLPKVNLTERDAMFNKAAHLVVQKKEISITMLMLELKLEFERVSKLIDDLRLAGIISEYNSKDMNSRKVLISDEDSLNLLFEIENEFA